MCYIALNITVLPDGLVPAFVLHFCPREVNQVQVKVVLKVQFEVAGLCSSPSKNVSLPM